MPWTERFDRYAILYLLLEDLAEVPVASKLAELEGNPTRLQMVDSGTTSNEEVICEINEVSQQIRIANHQWRSRQDAGGYMWYHNPDKCRRYPIAVTR